jgi:hypothetical protein
MIKNDCSSKRFRTLTLTATLLFMTSLVQPVLAETLKTRSGVLEFQKGYPTTKTTLLLYDELDYQRAIQSYLWAMPMASYGMIRDAFWEAGLDNNTVVLAEKSWMPENLFLTGNNDTVYLAGAINLKDGPVVFSATPGLLGVINNIWQQPLEDVGPFGQDKGKGGKYLLLPPGYDNEVPEGYMPIKCDTWNVIFYMRGMPKDLNDFERVAKEMSRMEMYPLSQADNPPKTKVIKMSGKPIDTLIREGFEYWERLAKFVHEETTRPEDAAMLGMLATLGIEKGMPFSPDKRMKKILNDAAITGLAMAQVLTFSPRAPREAVYFFPDRQWKTVFLAPTPEFYEDGILRIDARTKYVYEAIGTGKSMFTKIVGAGSQYMGAYQDANGEWLDGAKTYKLNLPGPVPARHFWSMTLYDVDTRSQLATEPGRVPIAGSVHGAKPNKDGSFDIYMGPKLPKGVPEANWIKTNPKKGFFGYIRIYGPEQEYLDKTWKPSDIAKIK